MKTQQPGNDISDPIDDLTAGCIGKVTFESFALASKVNKARGGRRDLKRQVYRCRCCRKWHLGTKR